MEGWLFQLGALVSRLNSGGDRQKEMLFSSSFIF